MFISQSVFDTYEPTPDTLMPLLRDLDQYLVFETQNNHKQIKDLLSVNSKRHVHVLDIHTTAIQYLPLKDSLFANDSSRRPITSPLLLQDERM